jgi:hypothetical protein
MNLASRLLENASIASFENTGKYGHDNGAALIAMESAELLNEIFTESFYVLNEAQVDAAFEGVSVEESKYGEVMEGAIASGFEKIKGFLTKLKNAVKEFFANVGTHLDSVFKSGEEFVTKYEEKVKALKLDGYTYEMYEYSDKLDSTDGTEGVVKCIQNTVKASSKAAATVAKSAMNSKESVIQARDEVKKEAQAQIDEAYRLAGAKSADDIDSALYALYRSPKAKKVKVDIGKFMDVLKTSKKSLEVVKKSGAEVTKAYDDAIKLVDDLERSTSKADKNDVASSALDVLRIISKALSTEQSVMNKKFSVWKTVLVERDRVYKSVIVGAFKYANTKKAAKKSK